MTTAVRGGLAGAVAVLAVFVGVTLMTGYLPPAAATPCDALRLLTPGFPCVESPGPTLSVPEQQATSVASAPQTSVATSSARTPTLAPGGLDKELGRLTREFKQGKLTEGEFRAQLERLINPPGHADPPPPSVLISTPAPTPTLTPTPTSPATSRALPPAAAQPDAHRDLRLLLLPLTVAVGLMVGAVLLRRRAAAVAAMRPAPWTVPIVSSLAQCNTEPDIAAVCDIETDFDAEFADFARISIEDTDILPDLPLEPRAAPPPPPPRVETPAGSEATRKSTPPTPPPVMPTPPPRRPAGFGRRLP